jgi:type IV secretory pathway TraG/TraD family ATPase VirD4
LLNTRFFFRNPSAEMAKFVSVELCNEELEEVKESTSYGANSIRDGVSLSSNRTSRPLVDYSEIMRLKILTCFARMPGEYPITKLELKLNKRPEKSKGFIERELPVEAQNNDSYQLNFGTDSSPQSSELIKKNLQVEFDV